MSKQSVLSRSLFITIAVLTALFAIFPAILMTEPGQSLNLPSEWVIVYYKVRWFVILTNLILLALLWRLNLKYHYVKNFWGYLATAGVLICIIAANFLLPTFFPTYQHRADYVSVQHADNVLQDSDIVYVVKANGIVKAYPRKHLEIPHIVGGNFKGKELVMTFCALSNLPVVYQQSEGETDLRILIQLHNNLIMVDENSGDLLQQITGKLQYSGKQLPAYPNTMMTWKSFKQLYPEATVFIYPFNRPLDRLLSALFQGPMEKQFSEQHGPIFLTLDLTDKRLPNKAQIYGLNIDGQQMAVTKSFLQKNPIFSFKLGNDDLVMVYDKKYDTVNAFSREKDGHTIDVSTISRTGNTPKGQLKQVPLYNGVFWMVWSHWFPNSKLYK